MVSAAAGRKCRVHRCCELVFESLQHYLGAFVYGKCNMTQTGNKPDDAIRWNKWEAVGGKPLPKCLSVLIKWKAKKSHKGWFLWKRCLWQKEELLRVDERSAITLFSHSHQTVWMHHWHLTEFNPLQAFSKTHLHTLTAAFCPEHHKKTVTDAIQRQASMTTKRTITASCTSASLSSPWLKKDLYLFMLAAPCWDNILKHQTSWASSEGYAFTLLPSKDIQPLGFGVTRRNRNNCVQGVMLIMCSVFLSVQRNLKIDSNCKKKKEKYFESSVLCKCCQY